ncbi:hypothetical protein [Labilibaculum euxinus]|uniref:Uncharacterized protein n=1 Tax=Labilibaculum euxinus TaxID=2686357 RepID=A0A7M4D2J0_9BACT|nr:hypothetical protein [Labilibaculum euxinus]MUP36869.1 hypothetical protein [Labilibaculum euxinus]MVB06074.1 hypothetical protein [Labilibaculum euxinus]
MNKILPIVYTIATILIIIGALFILQAEKYGLAVLSLGLVLNVFYRFSTLNYESVKSFKILDVLRLANILFMIVACAGFFYDWNQKFNFLILTIVFDLLLNLKEISFKSK